MNWFRRTSATVLDAAAAMDEGAALVDVRTSGEWRGIRPVGAYHIPLNDIGARTAQLAGTPVYVICRSGSRSRRATAILRRAGVDARNVRGGLLSWERHGLPVERGRSQRSSSRTRRSR
jgi:rhodanese-related sulfurtransferase